MIVYSEQGSSTTSTIESLQLPFESIQKYWSALDLHFDFCDTSANTYV